MFDAREGVFCVYRLISACAACVQCKRKLKHLSLQRMPVAMEPSDTRVRHQHILKAVLSALSLLSCIRRKFAHSRLSTC